MSTEQAVTQAAPNQLAAKAAHIDRVASEAMKLFEGAQSFEAELGVAQSIRDLRGALTQEIMAPVMALMNTDLGFLTDKDPRRAKQGETIQPYSLEIVRDCLIESKLRGFHCVGNEWNIISGRFYAAKAGLKRRCETWPGVTDLKINIGVPKMRDGGAIVNVLGSWKKDGVADKIETEIAVKVNQFMGSDAITGKAERKLYKRIFDRLSGRVTNDGEVDDEDLKNAKPANATVMPPPPPPPAAAQQQPQAQTTAPAQPQPQTTQAPREDQGPQDRLASIMVDNGISFDTFRQYAKAANWDGDWDSFDGYSMLSRQFAEMIVRAYKPVLLQISKFKLEKGL